MTLSDLAIKRPVFAWMLMLGLIVFGGICFTRLGVSQLPDVDFPILSVSVSLPGAAPEVMETEVSDVLEDAVMGVPGVKDVSSSSIQGQTKLSIEFELGKDIDIALQEVQTRIAQAQRNLPKEIDPPVISKSNPEDQPIMWVALSGEVPLKKLIDYARDHVKDRFTSAPGVGEVTLGGYIEPNVRIWVDQNKLSQYELSVEDVINTIEKQHSEIPAGVIENKSKEFNVRVMGEVTTMSGFENMVIPTRGGAPLWTKLQIKDVARVENGLNDIRRLSRFSGKPAIGLGIKKQRGVNAVEVAEGVKKRVAEMQKSLPKNMHLTVVFDTTTFIKESSHELNLTLVLAALITSVVCWLFMGSWSSAINIILAIPTSIMGAFIFLYFFGFTLNTFTLLGLSLVIGIVVDDAIMVLENIVRHREMGKGRVKGALDGAREITFAALAASVAILAIFIPVIFMKGIMGKFFFQFGITISAAVMISLLEALTLAPMRCSQFLDIEHTTRLGRAMDRFMEIVTRGYRRALVLCLRFRWTVIVLSILFFGSSFFVLKHLKKEFVPAQDQSRFLVRLQAPLGSSITYTNTIFEAAETKLMELPGIKNYFSAVGGFGGGEVNSGMMFVTMTDYDHRPINPKSHKRLSQKDLMSRVRNELKKIPGVVKVGIQDLSLSGFSAKRGYPVEFTLLGPDWTTLGDISEKLKKKMEETGYMVDVDSDYLLGMPEVKVFPDRESAAASGVSISSIGNTIEALIGGVRIGKYTENGKRYDIRVRLNAEQRTLPEQINHIWVHNNRGEKVPLSSVVRIEEKPALMSITRKNRERAISLFANVAPGKSQGEALAQVKQMEAVLPDGYRLSMSGSAQTYKDSSQSLIFALALGIFVAYMVLASQFNSFIHPVTVLLALPFSITGAFIALALSHQSLNIYSLIGILLLMGIVKKNSILLVDFTNECRHQGLSVQEALITACPVRLRPILMTSIATMAAAIPASLAMGPGSETRIPMAVVILGGVFVSTILTLFVVPCAYSLFSKWERKPVNLDD